jgi:pyruvate dehydrogenase E1 component
VPACVSYDVSFAYELATIIQDGMKRMMQDEENIYYYIALQNENYPMPAMPEGAKEGILKGIYKYRAGSKGKHRVQLFGGGSIMLQVLRAQEILAERYDVAADVWGVTSYTELRRDALRCERHNRLHPTEEAQTPYIVSALQGVQGPFIAASDYMKALQDQVSRWIPGQYVVLGTDGFGMSDTREALRRHFEVDAECIVIAALDALRVEGKLTAADVQKAIKDLGVDPDKIDPMSV